MSFIIDGYNLLNATGILPRGRGPHTLERSRRALLSFLVESLDDAERQNTTVVFDAGPEAPPGLPREEKIKGLSVRYATGYDDADGLIEDLIREDSAPRQLTVVSSDHRLHRAARRRRARAVDSDQWYAEIVARRRQRQDTPLDGLKPETSSAGEVDYWTQQFAQDAPPSSDKTLDSPFPPGYGEDLLDDEGP